MRKDIIALFGLLLFLFGVFSLSSPKTVKLFMYFIVFIVVYTFCLLFIKVVSRLAYPNLANNQIIFIAAVIALVPTTILALVTLSSLTILDLALVFILPAIMVWYGIKIKIIK